MSKPSTTTSNAASERSAFRTSGVFSSRRAINSSSEIGTRAVRCDLAFALLCVIPAPQTANLAAVTCWPTPAEGVASGPSSASCYHRIENSWILAAVKAKREFIEIQGQVLRRDLVIVPDDPALQERPKRFDGLRVNAKAISHISQVRGEPSGDSGNSHLQINGKFTILGDGRWADRRP